jgi:hypothetical protein
LKRVASSRGRFVAPMLRRSRHSLQRKDAALSAFLNRERICEMDLHKEESPHTAPRCPSAALPRALRSSCSPLGPSAISGTASSPLPPTEPRYSAPMGPEGGRLRLAARGAPPSSSSSALSASLPVRPAPPPSLPLQCSSASSDAAPSGFECSRCRSHRCAPYTSSTACSAGVAGAELCQRARGGASAAPRCRPTRHTCCAGWVARCLAGRNGEVAAGAHGTCRLSSDQPLGRAAACRRDERRARGGQAWGRCR